MTSERKRVANQTNAKQSTGPRSTKGKVRSARNAWRHGLNLPVAADPSLAVEVAALAACFRQAAPTAQARALLAAEAYFQLRRVRQTKAETLTKAMTGGGRLEPNEAVVRSASQLITLDGYERKALSKLKKALRGLEE